MSHSRIKSLLLSSVALLLWDASAHATIESYAITVRGSLDDPRAAVTANGQPGTISGGTYSVPNVLLTPGPNTITVTVTDGFSPAESQSRMVFLQNVAPGTGGTRLITARGSISAASRIHVQITHPDVGAVTVAGLMTGATYTITDIPIEEGANHLLFTASDGQESITQERWVFLDTTPPEAPTLETVPPFLDEPTLQLSGTKPPGTAVWIDGQEVMPLDHAATWRSMWILAVGPNTLTVTTRDAAGNASAAVTVSTRVLHPPIPPEE